MAETLRAGCPRCAAPIAETGDGAWSCPEHGEVVPVWRPEHASYDGFVAHLARAGSFPTYLPWPLGPGWSVTDFAVVAGDDPGVGARATMACVSGSSALDGPVDVMVISEEAGTGLGARVAGLDAGTASAPAGPWADGEQALGVAPPEVRIKLETYPVALWPVSTSGSHGEWDRSVLAGEAEGRWLWLVLRPASAILMLREEWILRDASAAGPQLLALPFGGPAPSW
ncbi:DUF6758 family protein [Nocardioides sp. YIM 152588]|uniref:DUF6758 family protein n=1 Tax=Nocardioides sp. YIM 152588 TaxID=3158259 RepID=UPI0032E3B93A